MKLVQDKDYFVITTNVDHCFQKAGFDKKRLFYTQGDYGLFQCSEPCCQETFDNEEVIREMVKRQEDMKIPTELLPTCPHCGKPLTMNLRSDDTFVEDKGWHRAAERYENFLRTRAGQKILFLELGVGYNTPVIIKYPFWQMTAKNPNATYICINQGQAVCPQEIELQSVCINADCESIARMSHALASFFRYSISRKENIVTLRDELSNIKNYFFIQQFRFEDRFFLDIQVEDGDDELLDCLLPKMTLQPIVENCVFHGLEPKAEQGHVTIRISGTKDMMKIIVEDDGVGMPSDVLDKMRAALEEERQPTNQPDTHGNGIAMYNVNQRIKLAFGRDYGLFVYSTENLGTDVEIWMPKVYTKEELLMQ